MRWLVWTWRWSLLVTVPVAAAFWLWLWSFGGSFADFRLRYDVSPSSFGFATDGRDHGAQLRRDLELQLTTRGLPDALPVLQLAVREDRLAALDSNLPHSGFEEVPGQLRTDDGWLDVDVRYRGDHFWHWAYPKKSWRVQVKGQQLAFGMAKFHLIAPKLPAQINDVAAYRLAALLDLPAPRAEAVVLFVNGHNRGLYLLVEHPDESMLRDRSLMPSDLYSGELVGRDTWSGVDNHVFDHPRLWAKMATNNHFPLDCRGPLEALCAAVTTAPDDAAAAALGELCDLDAFGRFFALETLLQCVHHDETHNWRLIYDPWRRRFLPMPWDTNAWGAFVRPPAERDPQAATAGITACLDPAPTRLHARLLAHPQVLAARAAALHRFTHGGTADLFLTELEALVERAAAVVPYDPGLRPPDPREVRAALQQLPRDVAAVFGTVRAAWAETVPVSFGRDEAGVVLQVGDRDPVTAVTLQLRSPAPEAPLRLAWRSDLGARQLDLPVEREHGGRSLRCRVTLAAALVPELGIGGCGEPVATSRPVPTTWRILATGGLPAVDAIDVERASGRRETAVLDPDLRAQTNALQLGVGAGLRPPPERWSGDVVVRGTRVVRGDLTLAAGAQVRLAEDANLIVHGRLFADGTARQPIRFVRLEPGAWGAVALQGPGSGGSRLSHCVFDGGSGSKSDAGLYEYTAMLSIHDATAVRLEDCEFRGSSRTDDVLHAVYSDLELLRCRFAECPSDAVDLDLSRATLRDCVFVDAGNDGLDLMTCDVVVRGCSFSGCGDKGISIGERSRLLVAETTFADCMIGMQVKDDSDAIALNCTITGGRRALDGLTKNWRYGHGGRLEARRCRLSGAAEPPAADARSLLLLRDCVVEPLPAAGANLVLEACSTDGSAPVTLPSTPLPFAIRGRQALALQVWSEVSGTTRGAP